MKTPPAVKVVRQLVHSLSNNNLVPFHLWLGEIVLKSENVLPKIEVSEYASEYTIVNHFSTILHKSPGLT